MDAGICQLVFGNIGSPVNIRFCIPVVLSVVGKTTLGVAVARAANFGDSSLTPITPSSTARFVTAVMPSSIFCTACCAAGIAFLLVSITVLATGTAPATSKANHGTSFATSPAACHEGSSTKFLTPSPMFSIL